MDIVKEAVIDLLSDQQGPALSSTSDLPVVETKPDASNEGVPPAAPSKTEVVKEEAKLPSESATEATDEGSGEPAKKESRGVQKALDRLTAEREAEKRRADEQTEARIRLEERLKLLEEAKPKPQTSDEDAPVKPSRDDFPDPDAWEEALLGYADKKAAYTARQEFKTLQAEEARKAEATAIEESQRVAREAYNGRLTKVQEKYPDFKEVAETPNVQISIPMAHVIINSESGPELQYYLGKNPEEAARIMTLAPPMQIYELGKIEAKLNAPPSAPKPAVSAAPRPIKPISAGTESSNKNPEEMSMEEYASYRKQQSGGRAVRH